MNEKSYRTVYIRRESKRPIYAPFPVFLMDYDLSMTARVLYALMFNRAMLSQINNWVDDLDRVFIVFTEAEMCAALQKGLSTVKKALADLEHFDLLTRERGGFGKLCSYQLLILDDFGMERDTSFALETVYDVIDGRYLSGKPLIVTTNLTLDELKKPQDVDHQRIYDRVLAMTVPIRFAGDSLRSGQRSTKREIVKDIFEGGDC